jgi:hypothetical protein
MITKKIESAPKNKDKIVNNSKSTCKTKVLICRI